MPLIFSADPSRCTVCDETVPGAAADPGNPWYGKQYALAVWMELKDMAPLLKAE